MEKYKPPRKRGQLSLDEEKFISDNINTLTIEDIASHLNRNVAPIKRYIGENKLVNNDDVKILKKSSFYESTAVPNNLDPKFINSIISITTRFSAEELIKYILKGF